MLTNQELKQLHKGVLRTFNQRELETLLSSKLGRETHNTYAKSDFSGFAFDLISDADIQGWMDDLLNALHHARPQEPVFRKLAGISPSTDNSTYLPTQHTQSKLPLQFIKFLLPVIILLIFLGLPLLMMSMVRTTSPTAVEVTVVMERITPTATSPATISQDSLPTIITWNSAMIDGDFKLLTLGGDAPYGASIRVLLDDELIENIERSPENVWTTTMPVPDSGAHIVRVELLDDDGQVVERFQRELELPTRP